MNEESPWTKVRRLSYRELIREHDRPVYSENYRSVLREEIRHRQNRAATRSTVAMTLVITLATISNVILWALK